VTACAQDECTSQVDFLEEGFGSDSNFINVNNYFTILNITNKYPHCPDAWNARARISETLAKKNVSGSQVGESFEDDAAFSYANYLCIQSDQGFDRYSKAYSEINRFSFNKTDYFQPSRYESAWKLKGDIESNLGYPRSIAANYSYSVYFKLSGQKKKAENEIAEFLSQVYSLKSQDIAKYGYQTLLSKAWKMNGDLSNTQTEKNFSYACSIYFDKNEYNKLSKIKQLIADNIASNTTGYRDSWYLIGLIEEENNLSVDAAKSYGKALRANESIFAKISTTNLSYCSNRFGEYMIKSNDTDDISEGYYFLALSHKDSNPNQSLQELNKSVAANTSNINAWSLRKEICQREANADGAYLDKANYCTAYIKFLQDDLHGAYISLNSAGLEKYIDTWMLKGSISEKGGDYSSALSNYHNAVSRNDSLFGSIKELYSNAYANLGLMELKLNNNYENALDDFYNSLINNATRYSNWMNIGTALFYMGHLEEAQSIFSYFYGSATYDSKDNYYWNKKGEILASRSWFNSSMVCFDNAINKSQFYRRAWYNRGLADINLENYEGAIKDLDNATLLISGNETDDRDIRAKAWLNRAIANSKLGKNEDSLIDLGNALELSPSNDIGIDIYYTKGLILLEMNHADEALQSFSKSMQMLSADSANSSKANQISRVWHGLGNAYKKAGNNQEALQCFVNCTSMDRYNDLAWIDKGQTERALGMEAESLISFDNARDAINHNNATIWCDLGYAWSLLSNEKNSIQKCNFIMDEARCSLDCFNNSIALDELYMPSYYNKSVLLLNSDNSSPASLASALALIQQASRLMPSVANDSKFKFLEGQIHYKQGNYDLAFDDLIASYSSSNSSKFNIDLLYFMSNFKKYEYYINKSQILQSESEKESLRELLSSIGKISASNSSENALPENGDLQFLANRFSQMRDHETKLILSIADSEYRMNLIDDAIQSYMDIRRIGVLNAEDERSMSRLIWLNWYLILLFVIIIFIAYRKRLPNAVKFIKDIFTHPNELDWSQMITKISWTVWSVLKSNIGLELMLFNIFGFLAFADLLSYIFDPSRAFWSVILQLSILFAIIILFIIVSGYRDAKLLRMAEATLESSKYYKYILLISLIFLFTIFGSIIAELNPLITFINNISVRYLMLFILGFMTLITEIPLTRALLSNIIDDRLRNFFAAAQFSYLSMASVPLIWLFWSYGMPIGNATTVPIEDMTFSVPVYSILLIVVFSALFIYPYVHGNHNYNRWSLKILKDQKNWMSSYNDNNFIENSYNSLVNELKAIFGDILPEIRQSNLCNSNETNFKDIKESLIAKHYWNENDDDPRISLLQNSEKILDTAKDLRKSTIKPSETSGFLTDKPAKPEKYMIVAEGMSRYYVYENPEPEDPFADPRKKISGFESSIIDKSAMWKGYVTVVLSPLITIVIGWIISAMNISLDQGSLTQLISDAVSASGPMI